MPYVSTTLPGQNPSRSVPGPLHISTSFSLHQLAPHHPIGKLLSVPPYQSSQSRVQLNTPVARITSSHASSPPAEKPLKSSLKRTSTLSNREDPASVPPNVGRNIPAAVHKRVRFNDSDGQLESVCVFRPTGRPSAISRFHPDSDSEFETSSSSDDDNDDRWRRRRASVVVAAAAAAALVPLEVADVISQIPSRRTPLTTCLVRLDSITPTLPSMRCGQQRQQQPLLLRGVVRVRNIAYEKRVAARYTFDDWKTTTETLARYVDPGDGDGAWDRFTFTIPLMLRAPPGDPPRTLLLAVRFTVPGEGEWWDNNGGDNFRVLLSQRPRPCAGSVTVTAAGHHDDRQRPASALGGPPGLGLRLPSSAGGMWDVSLVKNAAAEFPCNALAAPCSANVQAAMAGALPSMVW